MSTQRTSFDKNSAGRMPVDRIHFNAAALFLFSLPVSTALSGITMAILIVVTILNLPRVSGTYGPLVRTTLPWFALAWLAWSAITLFWSSDPGRCDREGADRRSDGRSPSQCRIRPSGTIHLETMR